MGDKGLNAEERLKGYKDALTDYGLAFHEENMVRVTDYSFEEGEKLVKSFIKKNNSI